MAMQAELKTALRLAREAFAGFSKHKDHWLAAAIAYFATFAMAPLIIVVVEIGGFFLGRHQVLLDQIYGYLARDAGPGAASALRSIVAATFAQRHGGAVGQLIGWALFLLGAGGLFAVLHDALNAVWESGPEQGGIAKAIHERLLGFGIVAILAILLLASVVVSASLSVAAQSLQLQGPLVPLAVRTLDLLVSAAFLFAVFAVLFKFLPDRHVRWRDVWPGAAFTAVAFVIGQTLLGWYLGHAGVASGFGAYGSLVIFLLWINYSAQIMLLGGEFAHAYAAQHEAQAGDARAGRTIPAGRALLGHR